MFQGCVSPVSVLSRPLYLQGAYKVANFPPWSSLHVSFLPVSAFSGLQKLFPQVSPAGNTTCPRSIPAKSSFCQHLGLAFHTGTPPRPPTPGASVQVLRKDLWQFSWSSRAGPTHTLWGCVDFQQAFLLPVRD